MSADRWVRVTERLPDKNTEVLICFEGQNTLCSTGQYTGSTKDVHGWCYPWENRVATDDGDDPVVTHWMPLPALPGAAPAAESPEPSTRGDGLDLLLRRLKNGTEEGRHDSLYLEAAAVIERLDDLCNRLMGSVAAETARADAAESPEPQPLTDEQLWASDEIMSLNADLGWHMDTIRMFARAAERAHGIGAPHD